MKPKYIVFILLITSKLVLGELSINDVQEDIYSRRLCEDSSHSSRDDKLYGVKLFGNIINVQVLNDNIWAMVTAEKTYLIPGQQKKHTPNLLKVHPAESIIKDYIIPGQNSSGKLRLLTIINQHLYWAYDDDNLQTKDLRSRNSAEIKQLSFDAQGTHVDIFEYLTWLLHPNVQSINFLLRGMSNSVEKTLLVFKNGKMAYLTWLSMARPTSVILKNGNLWKLETVLPWNDAGRLTSLHHATIVTDKVFGNVVIDTINRDYTHPYPVIPNQQLIGCMSSICWHPVMTDIIVIGSKYYILQHNWIWEIDFIQESAAAYREQISQEKAQRVFMQNDQDYAISAFSDPSYPTTSTGFVGLVVFRSAHQKCSNYASPLYKVKGGYLVDTRTRHKFPNTVEVEATASLHEESTFLIVGKRCNHDEISHVSYFAKGKKASTEANFMFEVKYPKLDPLPFFSITAMFRASIEGYLFIVSGYFLYIFKDYTKLNVSKCAVTTVASFFQCDISIYEGNEVYNSYTDYLWYSIQNFDGAEKLQLGNCKLVWTPFPNDEAPIYGQKHMSLPRQIVFPEKSSINAEEIQPRRFNKQFSFNMVMLYVGGIILSLSLCFIAYRYFSLWMVNRRLDKFSQKRRTLDFNKALLYVHNSIGARQATTPRTRTSRGRTTGYSGTSQEYSEYSQ